MRRLYNWVLNQSSKPYALWVLGGVAFLESSIFPIPPDIMLIPMILALRNRAWLLASICAIASVAGGLSGYALGYYLFDSIGEQLVQLYGYESKLINFKEYYKEWGGWIVGIGGITPLPYKLVAIGSGAAGLDPIVFLVASALSRGLRFFIVAALIWYFGPSIRKFFEQHFGIMIVLILIIMAGAFLVLGVI